MSEYIYLSSDVELPSGSIGDKGWDTGKVALYLSLDSLESFFFEKNYDPDKKENFSFSKHFSDKKYQVASIDLNLPEENQKHLNRRNKKALQELLNYIRNHFKNTNATYIEILFCLNSQENKPLKKHNSIDYNKLSIDDLYYDDYKFLTIKT